MVLVVEVLRAVAPLVQVRVVVARERRARVRRRLVRAEGLEQEEARELQADSGLPVVRERQVVREHRAVESRAVESRAVERDPVVEPGLAASAQVVAVSVSAVLLRKLPRRTPRPSGPSSRSHCRSSASSSSGR